MMANEESLDKELIDLFPLASLAKDAIAIVAKRLRPRTAGPASKVVAPVTEVTAAAPVPVVVVVCKINGRVAKAGAARTKATIRDLYILEVN